MEGINDVSPKGRERRLAKHLVDRSHRRGAGRRLPPSWTRVEKALLVLIVALLLAEVALAVVLVVP